MMRKLVLFAAGLMAAAAVLLSTGAAARANKELSQDAAEQVILRLLRQPVKEAVNDYCDGPHNPPHGLETMTFYVGPLDAIQLVNFDHQDEPD